MKKIVTIAAGALAALLTTVSCSDDKFTEQYQDPALTQNATCPTLMVGVWQESNTWMNPKYTRYYVQTTTSGRFSGVAGYSNNTARFTGAGVGYFNDRWKNFYASVTQFRALESTYNALSDEDKADNQIFLYLAQTVLYEQLYEMLSVWGGIPFTEAGMLFQTGNIAESKPAYDSDVDLYRMILSDLDEINTYLSSYTPTTVSSSNLTAEDYVNDGDVSLWQRYVNSVRLRVATHLASNGELATEAREVIRTMLGNPAAYPLVETNAENILVPQTNDDAFDFDGDLQSAIENSTYNRMSGFMQRALNANTDNPDPRLVVMYDANWDGEYIGLDPTEEVADQESNINDLSHGSSRYYAALDTATFTRNPGFPGIWMTAAEVAFMKAEAYANNWANGDAHAEFINGIQLSTDFYYELNSTGTYRNPIAEPDEATVTAYAESQWDASNPQKCIITQRWIHHGAIQYLEAWNLVRRTGYPELYFKEDPQTTDTPLPLNRLEYPSDELLYNPDNLANYINESGMEDNWYTKLFWMKDTWYTTIE